MRKWKILGLLVLFFLGALVAGYGLLERVTALQVLRWIARETNLPVQIHEANWNANGSLIWDTLWNRISSKKNMSIELSKLDFTFDFANLIKKARVITSIELRKTENDWVIDLAPSFTADKLPEIKGKLSIKLNIVKKITHGIYVRFEVESTKPYSLLFDKKKVSVEKWFATGVFHYKDFWTLNYNLKLQDFKLEDLKLGSLEIVHHSVSENKSPLPSQVHLGFIAKDTVFLKDKLFITETEIDGQSDFNLSSNEELKNLVFKITKPFQLSVLGDILKNKPSAFQITLDSPTEDLLDQRLSVWLSAMVEPIRRMKSIGKIKLAANAVLQLGSEKILESVKGLLTVDEKNLELPLKKLKIENLKLKLPFHYPEGKSVSESEWGNIQIEHAQFGSIDFYKIALDMLLDQYGVDLTTENEKAIDIPLVQNLWGGKIELSDLYTHFDFEGKHEFTARVKGGPFELGKIQKDFCIAPNKPLAGSMILYYPKIVQTSKGILLIGDTSFQIFSGTAYIGDMNLVFEKDYPKLKFNLKWNDLDLAKIGEWTNFGDMRGSLEGSLTNTNIQITPYGPIPLTYNFLIQGQPRSGEKIRFYGRAINNILELLGNQRENIPWYGRVLLDVSTTWRNLLPATADYMGFRAQNDGEWTELSTLDPPETVEVTKKYYFLYGSAFTIPLNSHGVYPVLMKTDAFQGWFSGMLGYFKERMKNDKNKVKSSEDECVPIW